jgi:DNA-binding protein HU-beta
MNKTDLVNEVASSIDMTKSDASIVVSTMVDSMIDGLLESGKLALSGLGTFSVVTRNARVARNPQTGEPVDVPAKKVVKFKMSSKLKEALNS